MRKLIIIFMLLSITLNAQLYQIPQRISKLSSVTIPSATHTQSTTSLDSLTLLHEEGEGILPIVVDSVTTSTNLSLLTDEEQLADSNRFFTNSNGWIIIGDGDTTNSPSDSSTVFYDSAGASFELPVTLTENQGYEITMTLEEGDSLRYGEQLLTTPAQTFSSEDGFYILQSNVTISSGLLRFTTASKYNSAYKADLVVIDSTYEVTYTISNYSSGTFVVDVGGVNGAERISNGTYIDTITATSNTYFRLRAWLVGANTFDIDNISLKMLIPSKKATVSIYQTDGTSDYLITTSDTVTSTPQTITQRFIGRGSDTLKILLSDSAKIKISDFSLKKINDYARIEYGDSFKVYFNKDISTVGTFNEKLYAYYSGKVDSSGIDYEVIPSSNILDAPYNLLATSYSGGVMVSWQDSNDADVVTEMNYTFIDEDGVSDFTTSGSDAVLSGEGDKLIITRSDPTDELQSAYIYYVLTDDYTDTISVDGYINTADALQFVVKGLSGGSVQVLYSELAYNDTSFKYAGDGLTYDSLQISMRGVHSSNGQYVAYDNLKLIKTAPSYDKMELQYLAYDVDLGVPDGDWATLTTSTTGDTNYTHSLSSTSMYAYRNRFINSSELDTSSWSNIDTALFNSDGSVVLVADYYVSSTGTASFTAASDSTTPMSFDTFYAGANAYLSAGDSVYIMPGDYNFDLDTNSATLGDPEATWYTFTGLPDNITIFGSDSSTTTFNVFGELPGWQIASRWTYDATYKVWAYRPGDYYTGFETIGAGRCEIDDVEYFKFMHWLVPDRKLETGDVYGVDYYYVSDNGSAKDSLFGCQMGVTNKSDHQARSTYPFTTKESNFYGIYTFYIYSGLYDSTDVTTNPTSVYTSIKVGGLQKRMFEFISCDGITISGLGFKGTDDRVIQFTNSDNAKLTNCKMWGYGYAGAYVNESENVEIAYNNLTSGFADIDSGYCYYEYGQANNGFDAAGDFSGLKVHDNIILDVGSMPIGIHASYTPADGVYIYNNLTGASRAGLMAYQRPYHFSATFSGGSDDDHTHIYAYSPTNIYVFNNTFQYCTREVKEVTKNYYNNFNVYKDFANLEIDSMFHHMSWNSANSTFAGLGANTQYTDGANTGMERYYFNNNFIDFEYTVFDEFFANKSKDQNVHLINNVWLNVGYGANASPTSEYPDNAVLVIGRSSIVPYTFENNFIWNEDVADISTSELYVYTYADYTAGVWSWDPMNTRTLTYMEANYVGNDFFDNNIEVDAGALTKDDIVNTASDYEPTAYVQELGKTDSEILTILQHQADIEGKTNFYDQFGNQITTRVGGVTYFLNNKINIGANGKQ